MHSLQWRGIPDSARVYLYLISPPLLSIDLSGFELHCRFLNQNKIKQLAAKLFGDLVDLRFLYVRGRMRVESKPSSLFLVGSQIVLPFVLSP